MNLSEPFIRRPVMTAVLTLSVILFGVLSYLQLPVNDLPAVDYPVIQVQVGYPGASPDTVASNIANADSATTPDGTTYRAKQVLFQAVPPESGDGPAKVQVAGVGALVDPLGQAVMHVPDLVLRFLGSITCLRPA